MAGLVTKLRELGTEVTDEALADVATVSAGNNRVVRHWFRAACLRALAFRRGGCMPVHFTIAAGVAIESGIRKS